MHVPPCQAKNKIEIRSNKKAAFKLRVACEKAKKMLSANAEAPINIECIMEDTDVRVGAAFCPFFGRFCAFRQFFVAVSWSPEGMMDARDVPDCFGLFLLSFICRESRKKDYTQLTTSSASSPGTLESI